MPDTTTDAGGAIPPLPWSGTRQFSPICQIKSKLIHLTAVSTRIAELASSPPPSSTMSTRRRGSLMSSPESRRCRTPACTSCCPGTGRPPATRPWLHRPGLTSRCLSPTRRTRASGLTSRGTHRMRTDVRPDRGRRIRIRSWGAQSPPRHLGQRVPDALGLPPPQPEVATAR